MTVPRFFVPDASTGRDLVRMPQDESTHLSRVLRLGVDARVRVFNGRGDEWAARVAVVSRGGVDVVLESAVTPAPEPPVAVTLAIGILKGDQMDQVVRDATMLGASAIAPIRAAHVSVPPRAWASGAAADRWRRVAIASAKQCGRAVVPEIAPITDVREWIALAEPDAAWIAVEPGASEGAMAAAGLGRSRPQRALVLIGPEGGWSEAELALARARGIQAVHFGPRTLRAESMPVVALSALWTMWGW